MTVLPVGPEVFNYLIIWLPVPWVATFSDSTLESCATLETQKLGNISWSFHVVLITLIPVTRGPHYQLLISNTGYFKQRQYIGLNYPYELVPSWFPPVTPPFAPLPTLSVLKSLEASSLPLASVHLGTHILRVVDALDRINIESDLTRTREPPGPICRPFYMKLHPYVQSIWAPC